MCEKTLNIAPQTNTFKCEACGSGFVQKISLKMHQESCQAMLSRRGSVMTNATNDSEASPNSMEDGEVTGKKFYKIFIGIKIYKKRLC